jgi:hypothetical protein
MLAILPLQDLLAMDGLLRHPDPHSERVNIPALPHHVWRWRLHVTTEELTSGLVSVAAAAAPVPSALGQQHAVEREAGDGGAGVLGCNVHADHDGGGAGAAGVGPGPTGHRDTSLVTVAGSGAGLAAAVRAMVVATGRDPGTL